PLGPFTDQRRGYSWGEQFQCRDGKGARESILSGVRAAHIGGEHPEILVADVEHKRACAAHGARRPHVSASSKGFVPVVTGSGLAAGDDRLSVVSHERGVQARRRAAVDNAGKDVTQGPSDGRIHHAFALAWSWFQYGFVGRICGEAQSSDIQDRLAY